MLREGGRRETLTSAPRHELAAPTRADLAMFAMDGPNGAGDQPPRNLVYACRGGADTVIVDGRI